MGAWLCCIIAGHGSRIGMGGGDDMGACTGGACAEEEDGGC